MEIAELQPLESGATFLTVTNRERGKGERYLTARKEVHVYEMTRGK